MEEVEVGGGGGGGGGGSDGMVCSMQSLCLSLLIFVCVYVLFAPPWPFRFCRPR